jgi:parallel beta-helix repeat protein
VWLAAGADATLTKNTVSKNTFAGVALVGDAKAIIDTNNITGVPESALALTNVGDGLFLGPGSTSTVKNNTMSSCWRAGVFTDGANSATKLSGNTLSGNDFAMILQGQAGIGLDGNNASMNVTSNGVDLTSAEVPAGKFGTLTGAIDVPVETAVEAQ